MTDQTRPGPTDRDTTDAIGQSPNSLAIGLIALAAGLAANALLGPLVANVVTYPFSPTLVNQTVGLEAVTLFVVVPWCLAAALLVRRGHPAGSLLAIAPPAYAAYMLVQYVVGPQYQVYRPVIAFHLALFVLSLFVLARAWQLSRRDPPPALTARRRRWAVAVLALLAAFTFSRYLPAIGGMATGASMPAEYAADPSMYWTIVLLDLGVVVPVALATAAGLWRGATWARPALYGVVGWFVLVPVSVAAMGIVMLANDDPNAAVGQVVVLGVAALLFTAVAGWVYRPLFRSDATK